MQTLLMFFAVMFLFSPSIVFANIIADIEIGGTSLGTKIFTMQGTKINCIESITFGKCKSKTLNDFGNVTIDETKDTKFIVQPKSACLPDGVKDFRQVKPFVAVESTSGFFNFAVSAPDLENVSQPSLSGGMGFHFKNTLFYSDIGYNNENGEEGFRRGNTYVKHDLDNHLAQVQAGDFFTVTNSQFLKSFSVGGVQFSRKYAIDPTINPYNSLDYKLTLHNKSRVEIYRDEQLVATQELPAGVYDLRNLPVAGFTGNLKLKVTDVYGYEQIINVPYFVDTSILKAGMDDFNVGFGFARENQYDNNYSSLKGGGFYRRGITESLTLGAGFSFDEIFDSAINIAYKTNYGVFSAEKDFVHLNDNYSVGYFYSADNFGFGANYTKFGNSDFRVQGSLSLKKIGLPDWMGSVTGQVFINGDKKAGMTHNFNIPKLPLSFIYDISYSNENKLIFHTTAYFSIMPRMNLSIGYSYDKVKQNTVYASLSIPLLRDYADYGYNLKAYKNNNTTTIDSEVSGRYYMLAKERSTYNDNDKKWTHSGMVSGSVAFSNVEGKTSWGIGEAISPGQGYFLSPPGKLLNSNGQTGSIVPVVPYLQTHASVQGKIVSVNKELSLREGQGIAISTTSKRSIKGILRRNGKPLKYASYFFDKEEFRTAKDGRFVIEGVSSNNVIITVNDRPVTLRINNSVSDNDELVDIGIIDISSG